MNKIQRKAYMKKYMQSKKWKAYMKSKRYLSIIKAYKKTTKYKEMMKKSRKKWSQSKKCKLAYKKKCIKYRADYPARNRAYLKINRAIKKGTIKKESCEKCGKLKTQAHHDDYRKPLKVRWLCAKHHNEHHRKK